LQILLTVVVFFASFLVVFGCRASRIEGP
jgi:hypothetical protein